MHESGNGTKRTSRSRRLRSAFGLKADEWRPLGLAAIGQSLVMRGLSLDLSIGGIVVAVTYILTSGYVRLPEAPLLAACLIFGMGIGAASKPAPGLLGEGIRAIFWGIVANTIYDHTIKPSDPPPQVFVTTDEVTVKVGSNTIIVPRAVYDASQNAKKSPAVEKG
jgi:hypothetical protein